MSLLDQEKMPPYRAAIKYRRLLKKLDPDLSQDAPEFHYAAVLLAAANVGTRADAIAVEVGYPRQHVRRLATKCRTANVFSNGKVNHGGWFGEDGGIAFWLDVSCCMGFLVRQRSKPGPMP